jgi:hypothetical protein
MRGDAHVHVVAANEWIGIRDSRLAIEAITLWHNQSHRVVRRGC